MNSLMFHMSLLGQMSPHLIVLQVVKQDLSLHHYCFYHPIALILIALCWNSGSLPHTEISQLPL